MRMVLEIINTLANLSILMEDKEWSGLLNVVKLVRTQHSMSGLLWADENTVQRGLQDTGFRYLLNI